MLHSEVAIEISQLKHVCVVLDNVIKTLSRKPNLTIPNMTAKFMHMLEATVMSSVVVKAPMWNMRERRCVPFL